MIFVTVGTQLAFDRLISAVDRWAAERPGVDLFAQIGPSRLRPSHVAWEQFISPEECCRRMDTATAIVAHAGMGTIIGALERAKPILVMPRRADLGEQRNDHQLATARRFGELSGVRVAACEDELLAELDALCVAGNASRVRRIGSQASDSLIAALRSFIEA